MMTLSEVSCMREAMRGSKLSGFTFVAIIVGSRDEVETKAPITITIPPGGLLVGESVTVTINGTPITYTATNPTETATFVRDSLISLINANVTVNGTVTANAATANTFSIDADAAQGTFTTTVGDTILAGNVTMATATGASSVNTTANGLPVAQVDTVTLSGTVGPGEIGDTWTINVGSQTVSYVANGTETSLNDVAVGIAALINANSSLGVTATALGATVQLTAISAGTPFSATVNASNGSTNSFIDVQFGTSAATAGGGGHQRCAGTLRRVALAQAGQLGHGDRGAQARHSLRVGLRARRHADRDQRDVPAVPDRP